ncbi:hypothetical protein [Micromonospora sp. CPCC 206061]|uniref:hypothetical protein n=1 Tax=Micromonospora sp. CPCC 206061 TaxID=3122410 RepID=UPI002FF0057C
MTEPPVRLVLDATAVAAYGRGNVAVGEIIAEVADEDAAIAVPDICLIEGAHQLDRDDWHVLDLLLAHSHVERLDLPQDWRDVAAAARLLGSTSRAVAMLAAVDLRAYVLTAEPEAYGAEAAPVIGF